jgi:hypothetical protein
MAAMREQAPAHRLVDDGLRREGTETQECVLALMGHVARLQADLTRMEARLEEALAAPAHAVDPRVMHLDFVPNLCLHLCTSRCVTLDDAARILARAAEPNDRFVVFQQYSRSRIETAQACVATNPRCIVVRATMQSGWATSLVPFAMKVLRLADEVLGAGVATECRICHPNKTLWGRDPAVAEWTEDGRLARLEPNPDGLPLAS